jgi:enolase-phosphatase E1
VSPGAGFVLLDIEGTTTPVDFVYRVLFPDARERVLGFIETWNADPEIARDIASLGEEHGRDVALGHSPPPWDGSAEAAAAYARWLMDQDRKLTPLKSLQGRIWAEGYATGRLRGQVYADVPEALMRWTADSRRVAIFSSGSVLAQKLLFGNTDEGDLTRYLSAYFDTTTGPKGEPDSYRRIATALGEPASAGLFVSDVVAELDAARDAGLATALAVRTPPGPDPHRHRVITSFAELD